MASAWTKETLCLYAKILRLHRRKLPHAMRELGDRYVRSEFRAHRNAKPEHLTAFHVGWADYARDLQEQQNIGRDMQEGELANLSDEQRRMIEQMRIEANKK